MFRTNLKYAFRRLLKQPIFTSINGIGLTLGLVAFLFIMQYVVFQRSFNTMYPDAQRTYLLMEAMPDEDYLAYSPPGIVPRAKENVPGVEHAARYVGGIGSGIILIEQAQGTPTTFRQNDMAFVDDDFLKIFPTATLEGTPDLTAPQTIVLTQSAALQYFQTTDVVNESLKIINQFGEHPFRITGVIEDFSVNSDVGAAVLASISTFESKEYLGYNTWLDLNTLSSNYGSSFFTLSNAEVADNLIAYRKSLFPESDTQQELKIALQSVSDMHLDSELPSVGNARLVWFLLLLAILILAIAWINYINLSTAQSLKKAHSVSVKKVIGAARAHLIKQQLTETFVLTALSTVLAIGLCFLLQPLFNYLVDYPLSLFALLDWKTVLGTLAFVSLTSLTAGFYVAFVLTGFNPSLVLKGSFLRSKKGILMRKTLVTAQFGITIAFIAGTAIMLMQIAYLENKDTGIATEKRLAFTGPGNYGEDWMTIRDAFVEQIEQLAFVKRMTGNGGNPGRGYNMSMQFNKDRERALEGGEQINTMFIDEDFLEVFEVDILAGNAPTPEMVRNGWWSHKKIILNETATKHLGFENPMEAVNEVIYFQYNGEIQEREILAVIEDYNQSSLHQSMEPIALAPSLNQVWFTLEVAGETSSTQLAQLESIYKEHFPKSPFVYHFVDDYYRSFYAEDRRLGQLVSVGAFLAIFISCLGLLGLVMHAVEQRTKEIGIRKVLGASVAHIVGLISKDFVPLIIFAIFIATPLAYYAMSQWLEDFAYRIEIPWWVFALAGVAAIGIASLTVSVQSVRAALANPVESLRNE
ncbi:MAG: FtsX-like permease family protein [Bacteroidota bacterium]